MKSKRKTKRKPKSERQCLIENLDETCKNVVRERDNWCCQHCGKAVSGSDAHWSHVIPKSKGNALRWDLLNVKLLCFHCHIGWWHQNPLEASEWFEGKFPARWKYLQKRKNEIIKFTSDDLKAILKVLKEKLKDLKEESYD